MNRRTAYHEAGHAVVGLLVGIPIASVSIVRDATTAGRCTRCEGIASAFARAVWLTAGPIAAAKATATRGMPPGCGSDISKLAAIHRMAGPGGTHVADAAFSAAADLIGIHWCAIGRVAGELLRRGTITGRGVADIAGVSYPQARRWWGVAA